LARQSWKQRVGVNAKEKYKRVIALKGGRRREKTKRRRAGQMFVFDIATFTSLLIRE